MMVRSYSLLAARADSPSPSPSPFVKVCGYSLLAVPTGIAAAEYSLSSASSFGQAAVHAGMHERMHASGGRAGRNHSRRLRGARNGWRDAAAVPVRACPVCHSVGHDADAAFCKHCGAEMTSDDV